MREKSEWIFRRAFSTYLLGLLAMSKAWMSSCHIHKLSRTQVLNGRARLVQRVFSNAVWLQNDEGPIAAQSLEVKFYPASPPTPANSASVVGRLEESEMSSLAPSQRLSVYRIGGL